MKNVFPSLKCIFLLITVLFINGCGSERVSTQIKDDCPASETKSDLDNLIFETGLYSNFSVTALSGNSQEAIDEMYGWLKINISVLYGKLKSCDLSQKNKDRIYSMLRVAAAVNHKTPIPQISDDPEIMAVFKEAIQNNPKHYEELINRSKHWSHGIN